MNRAGKLKSKSAHPLRMGAFMLSVKERGNNNRSSLFNDNMVF